MYVCMGVFVWYIFEVCVCMSVASVYMCVIYGACVFCWRVNVEPFAY